MQQQLRKHRNEEESIRKKRVFSRYKNIFLEILKIFRDWKFLIIKETWKILCIFILLCRAGKKHRRALWLLFFFLFNFPLCKEKIPKFLISLYFVWGMTKMGWYKMTRDVPLIFILFFIALSVVGGKWFWQGWKSIRRCFLFIRRKIGLEVLLVPTKADHRLTHTTYLSFSH